MGAVGAAMGWGSLEQKRSSGASGGEGIEESVAINRTARTRRQGGVGRIGEERGTLWPRVGRGWGVRGW